ncbi:hypothetical protein K7432_006019 [Basidiobolus ranarum]|uniref:MSP domain-containing protein n=1 Tax=Basidiobolus ranarum TaxID=34480 RepID=A0ABR2WVK0_9FUNG
MDVSNQENLVRISPKEFNFSATVGAGGARISRLSIRSLQTSPVGFKFKTNAPLRYSVRPVYGVLERLNSVAEVYVRCESDVQPSDRFLIQTVQLTTEEAENMGASLWRSLDRKRILEHFINCKVVENSVYASHSRSSSNDSLFDSKGFSTVSHKRIEPLTKSGNRSQLESLQEDNAKSILTDTSRKLSLFGMRFSRQELFLISFVCLILGIFVPTRQILQLLYSS